MYLQAGAFRILYNNGFLRQISQGNTEVVRMVYYALRDQNWGTFALTIEDEKIESHENSFRVSYTSYNINENHEALFEWKVVIKGDEDGQIIFEIAGKALQDVLKNRAGFCVLHPIEGVVTQPLTIVHDDSSTTYAHFPRYIAAEDPFLNIRSMHWNAANGGGYQLDFEGDIFQTEDQRNWGDASYKTFCTPLSQPFPVQLHQGDTVWQRVTFRAVSMSNNTQQHDNKHKEIDKPRRFSLGIGASEEVASLSFQSVSLLQSLDLSHYRIDLTPASTHWISTFSNHCENAALLNLPLEIALTLGENYEEELACFVGLCQQNRLKISNLMLFSSQSLSTSQVLIDQIPSLKQALPNVKIGVGTNYNFTELNRNRFEAGEADFITFSYHPQVHAFDDMSLMENTETLLYQIESAEKLYQKPVHVSFISLRQRANPYAANLADFVIPIEKQADTRQKTSFAAEWTNHVLRYLSQTSVHSVTLFRTVGALGVLSASGLPFPVFNVIKNRIEVFSK
jgi:D-apionolactonase